jgi:hypothetical protein
MTSVDDSPLVGGIPWVGDVTSHDDAQRLVVEAAAALGRIDGFVDIVGMASPMAAMSALAGIAGGPS